MFGIKRVRYRQMVETNLSYLVGLDEPYFQKLYRSFDGLQSVIDRSGKEGRDAMEMAVEIWGIMFSYEIERTPVLVENGESIIDYINAGQPDWRWDTEKAIRTFIFQAEKQVVMGRVPKQNFEIAVSEIVGALRGIPREERSRQRMIAITNTLLTKQSLIGTP